MIIWTPIFAVLVCVFDGLEIRPDLFYIVWFGFVAIMSDATNMVNNSRRLND